MSQFFWAQPPCDAIYYQLCTGLNPYTITDRLCLYIFPSLCEVTKNIKVVKKKHLKEYNGCNIALVRNIRQRSTAVVC